MWTLALGAATVASWLSRTVSLRRYEVANPPESDFGDVASALSRDEVRVLVPVRFKLTPKTWFVVEGEYANYGFLYDAARDGIGYRLGLGFELQSSTRLSGRVVAGPSAVPARAGSRCRRSRRPGST